MTTLLYYFVYLASFNIWVLFIHVSGQAKVRDLHLPPFSNKDISCCKVPVDKLLDQHTHLKCLTFFFNRHLSFLQWLFHWIVQIFYKEKHQLGLIPSFLPGTACLWKSARQRRSGHPWWEPCRLGSPGSLSFGWHPCPYSSGQLSDSHEGNYGVTHTWHTRRWDTMDLFREAGLLDSMCNTHVLGWDGKKTEVLPSWLQAPYIFMTCGWLTCFSRVNSDSRSRSSLWEAFSVTEEKRGDHNDETTHLFRHSLLIYHKCC